jgi:hypothetical protein
MRGEGLHHGNTFSAALTATLTTTNPTDLISIVPSTGAIPSRVQIQRIVVATGSTANVPVNMGIELWRGSTNAAIGAAVTPRNHAGWSAAPSAGSSVSANSTTLLSTASAVLFHADAMSNGRFEYCPQSGYEPIIESGQRFHVRGTGAAAGSVNVTLTFREIGKP